MLDYANAMVSGTSSGSPTDWQEHVAGKPQYAPPVPPLAPAKFTGGLYLKGNLANCKNFASSEQKTDATYVQTVTPKITVATRGTGDRRHARLHVLGGRVPISAQGLHGHGAAQHL